MMLSDDECIGESSAPRESPMNTSISSNASSSGMSASTNWTSPSPIDKLRTIKPFEEKQLLNFYSNSLLDSNEQLVEAFVQRYVQKDRNEHYDSIVRLERFLERFTETDTSVSQLIDSIHELESKCWTLKKRSLLTSDRCSDGQLVESHHEYRQYTFDDASASELNSRYYYLLRERLTNDHIVGQFQYKYGQIKFELMLVEMLELVQRVEASGITGAVPREHDQEMDDSLEPTIRLAKEQLQDWIAALFVYYRKTECFNEQLKAQCTDSLILLSQEYLKIATLSERLFLLNQILRCSSGSSATLSPLIDCPNPLPFRSSNFEYGKQLVDYAVTVISTILSPILERDKFIGVKSPQSSKNRRASQSSPSVSEPWLLVDTDFDDELVNLSPFEVTEFDLINYLQRVPFEQVLQFMSLIDKAASSSSSESPELSQNTEIHMIKLFAFSTRLIGILRSGLQSFNCLRYKELTLVIASMIKQIIRTISDQWAWCKVKFTTTDQALLVRLQVEFDSFMLRSIMAILSTNRRGVWPLLAKIEFNGISEAMLWHILWVVYNNGHDGQADLSGLCPYMSANYWKDKFANYRQWKYVFIEKLSNFSVEEATGLVDFFTNMATSRDERIDGEFLIEIVKRIAEICLLKKVYIDDDDAEKLSNGLAIQNQEFYLLKGNIALVNLLNQFKSLTTVLLSFIAEQGADQGNIHAESCLKLFESLLLEEFVPDGKFFYIVYGWLVEKAPNQLVNQVARIVLSKLGWNRILLQSNGCLLLSEEVQRRHALSLYQAVMAQVEKAQNVGNENAISKSSNTKLQQQQKSILSKLTIDRESIGSANSMRLARSTELEGFLRWAWASLLVVRVHPLDAIPDESAWDEIVCGPASNDSLRQTRRGLNMKHRIFQQLPRLAYDTEMASLNGALEASATASGEANPFAGYIALMMSDLITKHADPSKYLEVVTRTLARPNGPIHHLPLLSLLCHYVPLSLHQWECLRASSSFISLILSLVQNHFTNELCSIILTQMKHFHRPENALQLAIAWTEILYETLHLALSNAGKSGGWLPSVLSGSASNTTAQLEDLFEQVTLLMDRIAEQIVLSDGNGTNNYLFEKFIGFLAEKPYTKLVTSPSVTSKLTSLVESPSQSAHSTSTPNSTSTTNTTTSSSWSLMSLLTWSSTEESDVFYLPEKSLLKSEWCTPLHLLLRQAINRKITRGQKTLKANLAKKFTRNGEGKEADTELPFYLAYCVIEADMRRGGRIWDHLLYQLNNAQLKGEAQAFDFEAQLKSTCQILDKPLLPFSLLPINSLIVWLLAASPPTLATPTSPHPILPLLWKSFFQLYFSHSGTGSSSLGRHFLNGGCLDRLANRLTLLADHHNRRWLVLNNQKASGAFTASGSGRQSVQISSLLAEDRLLKLYRAYRLWLTDIRLHSSFVNLDDDTEYAQPEFQSHILKYIFSAGGSSTGASSRSSSPISGGKGASLADTYATNFFFLNYVEKGKLTEELLQVEALWNDAIKKDATVGKMKGTYMRIEDDSDAHRRRSNERASRTPTSASSRSSTPMDKSLVSQTASGEGVKARIGQYRGIIEYFSSLTASMKINLLFDDSPFLLDDPSNEAPSMVAQDPSVIIVIIHQLIDTVLEEARFVEVQLQKYGDLNREFSNDILPKLYQNIHREIKKRIPCERDEFDANGCTGAAILQFEFVESVLDQAAKQKYDRNRAELASVLRTLTREIPVQKVVGSVYYLSKVLKYALRFFDGDPSTTSNQQRIDQLLKSTSGWIALLNSVQGAKYFVTGQVLDQLLETLHTLSLHYMDSVNYFLLETALQRNMSSSMIQQLAPCLSPSKCTSPGTFIDMYSLLTDHLLTTPQQTVFVLLSKFDVPAWLSQPAVTDEQRHQLLSSLYQALYLFGLTPSDEHLVTFDLYRKHLQDLLLYRFPLFMESILQFMLHGMSESSVAPTLWNSLLHTFGFYTKSLSFGGGASTPRVAIPKSTSRDSVKSPTTNLKVPTTLLDFDFVTFDLDLREYTHRQSIFSSHELYELLKILVTFHQQAYSDLSTEFLDHFKSYATKYLQFLSFLSYCWIATNSSTSNCPDDLSIVWRPFADLWKGWILPKRTTRFIASEHLHFAWQLYTNGLAYMVASFPAPEQVNYLLSQVWQAFLGFIVHATAETVDQKDVEMMESKLMQLKCWATFEPTLSDIELMYESVLQNHHSIERFLAYVICRINWARTLATSTPHNGRRRPSVDQLSTIVDSLSCVLIALSEQPFMADMELEQIPFAILSPEKVKQITLMLLPAMKQKLSKGIPYGQLGVFFKAPTTNGEAGEETLLLALLRTVCDVVKNRTITGSSDNSPVHHTFSPPVPNSLSDSWFISKNLIYTQCIASLIGFSVNNGGALNGASEQVRAFLQNWIDSLRATLDCLESKDRVLLFDGILSSINLITDDGSRKKLATIFVTVFSYALSSSCIYIGDLIMAINRTVGSVSLVVYLLECFIETYLDLKGDVHFLVLNLNLNLSIGKASSSVTPAAANSEEPSTSTTIIESVRSQSCLLLLVHLYHRLVKSTVPESCTRQYGLKLIEASAGFKATQANGDEAKVLLYFYALFTLLTGPKSGQKGADGVLTHLAAMKPIPGVVNLSVNDVSEEDEGGARNFAADRELYSAIQTVLLLSKTIHETISESLNRGWLFFRTAKQSSNWCLFLLECLVLHGTSTLLELFYPQTLELEYSNLFPSLANGAPLNGDNLARSCSKDSLTSSQSSSSNSANSRNSGSPLYSDTIRQKVKSELREQLKCSHNRLLKTWKRDKSFSEIWSTIDELAGLYSNQIESLGKALARAAFHRSTTFEGDLDSLDGMATAAVSPASEEEQVLSTTRKQWAQLQTRRMTLIRRTIETLYGDKQFVKAFL